MTELIKLISLSLIVCNDGAYLIKLLKNLKKYVGAWTASQDCLAEVLAAAVALAQCVYYCAEMIYYANDLGIRIA